MIHLLFKNFPFGFTWPVEFNPSWLKAFIDFGNYAGGFWYAACNLDRDEQILIKLLINGGHVLPKEGGIVSRIDLAPFPKEALKPLKIKGYKPATAAQMDRFAQLFCAAIAINLQMETVTYIEVLHPSAETYEISPIDPGQTIDGVYLHPNGDINLGGAVRDGILVSTSQMAFLIDKPRVTLKPGDTIWWDQSGSGVFRGICRTQT